VNAQFPDSETMRAAFTLASMAPSVRNSQPWHWQICSDYLRLSVDPRRKLVHTDFERRDVLLSCGAALHHCVIALAALGWFAKIHRFPDPGEPDYLAKVELSPQSPTEQELVLSEAIPRRHSDRRNYGSRPVPMRDITLMGARAARAGVMLRQIDLLPKLSAVVAAAVRSHADAESWTGQQGSAALSVRSCGSAACDDNAAILALGTEDDDDLARLRAGEATSLVLLSATAMGLNTCPVTECLEAPGTLAAVRADVFGTSGYPQMMLRVGWAATDSEPLPATSRRPLAETVSGLSTGAVGGLSTGAVGGGLSIGAVGDSSDVPILAVRGQ
jgi:nitroreductase